METDKLGTMENLFSKMKQGRIDKHKFIESMKLYHDILFQYSSYLDDNIINSITISTKERNGVQIKTKDGIIFNCDPDDVYAIPMGAFSMKNYEPVHFEWLTKFMSDHSVFFDIGANVGWYSLHLAKHFPKSLIVAFEPVPKTFKRLASNITSNALGNVRAVNIALNEKNEELVFYVRPDMTGAASARNITENDKAIEVRCDGRRLDNYWQELGANPDIMKIDVEGGEIFVLRGGEKCLSESKPIVFCEMLRKWSDKFGYTPNDTIRFMEGLGYMCFESSPEILKRFERMTEMTEETNFFFLHKDKHQEIIKKYTDC